MPQCTYEIRGELAGVSSLQLPCTSGHQGWQLSTTYAYLEEEAQLR